MPEVTTADLMAAVHRFNSLEESRKIGLLRQRQERGYAIRRHIWGRVWNGGGLRIPPMEWDAVAFNIEQAMRLRHFVGGSR